MVTSVMISNKDHSIYKFGLYQLEAAERRLLRDGKHLPLTAKVFDLLLLLVRNSKHLIEKRELMNRLWPDSFVEDNNLTVSVAKLRSALGEDHTYIETVPRLGYRFIADVKILPDSRLSLAPSQPSRSMVQTEMKMELARDLPSIAVLPLENATGDQEMNYLCDGITNTIINSLSQLSQLRVMARDSVFRFRGRNIDPRETGRELGATVMLVGTVLQYNGHLVISVELVDVLYGWQLWGEQFYRKPADLFAVQNEIASDISDKLRIKVFAEERERMVKQHTRSVEAYYAYLKGWYCLNKRTMEYFSKGIKYFMQAVNYDPNYALAYAGLAESYNLLYSYGALPPRKAIAKMRTAVKKALALNSELAEAHAARGFILLMYDCDLYSAQIELKRAVELNPNYVRAHHWYANCLMMMSRFDEAMTERRTAQEIDPLSLVVRTSIASQLIFARQYDQAIEESMETLELDSRFYIAHAQLAMAHAFKGEYKKGIAAAQESFELSKDLEVFSLIGYIHGLAEERGKALQVLNGLKRMAKQRYVDPAYIALIFVGLGESDQAFAYLQKAFETKSSYLNWMHLDPRIDDIRYDPRFSGLLRRIWGDESIIQTGGLNRRF